MKFTTQQDDLFFCAIAQGENCYEEAVKYIAKNLKPEDVFSVQQLTQWAWQNGMMKSPDPKAGWEMGK